MKASAANSPAATVGVLGTGWLGLPLAKSLLERGYAVRGSYRSDGGLKRLSQGKIAAFRVDLPEYLDPAFLDGLDHLVVTLPPGGRRLGKQTTANYLAKFERLLAALPSPAPHVVFTSSSGVYGFARGEVDETSPTRPTTHSGRAVLAAEHLLAAAGAPLTVLRLAGLIGPGRHPGRFYGGRGREIPRGLAPVNLVYLDDVISAIALTLTRRPPPGGVRTYNVCAAEHPPKGQFYARAAAQLGLPTVGFEPTGQEDKTLVCRKLRTMGWCPRTGSLLGEE